VKLAATLRKVVRRSRNWLAYHRAGLLRGSEQVRERWTGAEPLEGRPKVCVFVHYDRRGTVHDFTLHYLEALHAAGFAIVFVSNAPRLDERQRRRIAPFCALMLRRANRGYDFGAYKDGIAAIPRLKGRDQLLIANDSIYGPLQPLEAVLEKADPDRADVWGMTDSWEKSYHLQSYFVLFMKAALASEAFASFWGSVRYLQSKTEVIRRYEIGMAAALFRDGLRVKALYPYRQVAASVERQLRNATALWADQILPPSYGRWLRSIYDAIQSGAALNSTHFFWDVLLVEEKFPFIKRELLLRNPVGVPLLSRWPELVRQVSDYDVDLITDHLKLIARKKVF